VRKILAFSNAGGGRWNSFAAWTWHGRESSWNSVYEFGLHHRVVDTQLLAVLQSELDRHLHHQIIDWALRSERLARAVGPHDGLAGRAFQRYIGRREKSLAEVSFTASAVAPALPSRLVRRTPGQKALMQKGIQRLHGCSVSAESDV
jgi:hypothetical protein